MAAHRWMALSCKKVEHGGCGKCFRHCTCPDKHERVPLGPLAGDVRLFLDNLERTVSARRRG